MIKTLGIQDYSQKSIGLNLNKIKTIGQINRNYKIVTPKTIGRICQLSHKLIKENNLHKIKIKK